MICYSIHPKNPQLRIVAKVVDILKNKDGICVYPTDTVYGIGACSSNSRALHKIGEMLQKDKTRRFSYICCDFSQISLYAKISNRDFRIMKRYLPGPYTFLLNATNYVPKKVCPKRRVVGIRLPACQVCIELVKMLGEPLANTSIRVRGEENRGDPSIIRSFLEAEVDVMLDAGVIENAQSSTIIDLTSDEPLLIREGKGIWNG